MARHSLRLCVNRVSDRSVTTTIRNLESSVPLQGGDTAQLGPTYHGAQPGCNGKPSKSLISGTLLHLSAWTCSMLYLCPLIESRRMNVLPDPYLGCIAPASWLVEVVHSSALIVPRDAGVHGIVSIH